MRLLTMMPSSLVLAAMLAACAETPTDPVDGFSAAVGTSFTLPIELQVFNDCTGEDVGITGTLHVVSKTINTGKGGSHLTQHFDWRNVKAVGATTGTVYHAQRVFQFLETNSPLAFNRTTSVRVHFVAGGSELENFWLVSLFQVVRNGNGDLVISERSSTIECR